MEEALNSDNHPVVDLINVHPLPLLSRSEYDTLLDTAKWRGKTVIQDLGDARFEVHWQHDNDFLSNVWKKYEGLLVHQDAEYDGNYYSTWAKSRGYVTYLSFSANMVQEKLGKKDNRMVVYYYMTNFFFKYPRLKVYLTDTFFLYPAKK